jgi:hypothetical protein
MFEGKEALEGSVMARRDLSAETIRFLGEPRNLALRDQLIRLLASSQSTFVFRNLIRIGLAWNRGLEFRNLVPLKALSQKDLHGIEFDGVDLSGYSFSGSNLDEAAFVDCDLSGVSFREAVLKGTRYVGCTVDNADFDESARVIMVSADGDELRSEKALLALREGGARIGAIGAIIEPREEPALEDPVKAIFAHILKKFMRGAERTTIRRVRREKGVLERGLDGRSRAFARRVVVPRLKSSGFLKFREVGASEIAEIDRARIDQIVEFVLEGKTSPDLVAVIEGSRADYGRI